MEIRRTFILLILTLLTVNSIFSQNENLKDVAYNIIAEGTDAPIETQIVCNNKFFNKDYLPVDFRKKYNLDQKDLYKKQMLIEVFHSDSNKEGVDKIELVGITENEKIIIAEYNIINSNTENDNNILSPFLIVQIPKSKKGFKFIVNGEELGKTTKTYLD